jgi:polysaccharide pyruvyl transferase CsaB
MTERVLLSGYYGFGNAGDEAVLTASVRLFRRLAPDVGIEVLSADPAETQAALGVEACSRMRPEALGALRRCSLFLSGGGSVLQDRTSLKSLLYYLALLALARRLGRRTMVFAQGIGPLVRPAARRLTARVLRRVDRITVRDPDSAALLREIGVPRAARGEIEVTADPVFALEPELTERVRAALPPRPAVAVSLRPWPGVEALLDPIAEALRGLPREVAVQAWALFPAEDRGPCRALVERVPGAALLATELAPPEWMALAGEVDAVLAMRLHALIFGAASSVPVVGISYDPKVDALLARLGTSPAGTAAHLDAAPLRAEVERALDTAPAGAANRRERAAALAAAARRNVEIGLELLRTTGS